MVPTEPDLDLTCFAPRWQGGPIESARLRLRLPKPGDAPAIVELAGAWEVARYTALIPHPYPPEAADDFIRQSAQDVERDTGDVVFALERRDTPGLIGCLGLHPRGGDRTDAEIGYWLGQPYWGQGYVGEAVRRALRFAFTLGGFETVHAAVLPENVASLEILKKAGFTEVGIDCGAHGRCAGKAPPLFRLTKADWAARHAARPKVPVAAVAMIDADGRVLLAQRPPGKSLAGFWEFPGGKIHGGETPEEALIRELDEELGIDVSESCLAPLTFASHDYDSFHLLMPLYVCRSWRGTPTPREGQTLAWVRPEKLASYAMPPADVPLVAMLRDWL